MASPLKLAGSFDMPEQDESAIPAVKKPAATGQAPLPALQAPGQKATPTMGAPMAPGGAPSLNMAANTADPLAFQAATPATPAAPALTMAPSGPAPFTPPVNTSSAVPAAPVAPTYTPPADTGPLTGRSNDEINKYWADQFSKAGMQGVVGGGTTGLTNNPATGKVDQSAAIAGQDRLANDPSTAGIVKSVQDAQAAGLAGRNDASQSFDTQQSAFDAATGLNSLKDAQRSPEIDAEWMRTHAGPGYGEPTNNPTATPGLPSNYHANTTPNNGAVDANGTYRPPSTDVATFGQGNTDTVPRGTSSADAGQAGGPTTTPLDINEINPDDSLLSKVITPGQGLDRTKIFQDSLNSTIKNVIDPSYDASARNLNRYNFGAGRGVSGEARTSQGDLANERERRIADLAAQGTAGALTGNIDDYWRGLDETQQERGFQQGERDTAFNQAKDTALLDDSLTNSAFNRALGQQNAGYADSPEKWDSYLSSVFGDQAGAAAKAASGAFGNAGASSGGGAMDAFLKWLRSFGGGGSSPAKPDGGYVDDVNYGGGVPA